MLLFCHYNHIFSAWIRTAHTSSHFLVRANDSKCHFWPKYCFKYLIGGHFADRVACLQGLQLVQTPIQLFKGLDGEFLICLICNKQPQMSNIYIYTRLPEVYSKGKLSLARPAHVLTLTGQACFTGSLRGSAWQSPIVKEKDYMYKTSCDNCSKSFSF